MNLPKLSTPGLSTNRLALAAVFLGTFFLFLALSQPIASTWIDPWAKIPAQDEALYAHATLRIASGEDPLTPHFLGRLLLVKPPLLLWLSAAAVKLFGFHLWALRLPSLLAASAVATLLFRRTGPIGLLLLLSRPFWLHRAGLLLMDDLLTLLWLLALLLLEKDPKLACPQSPWLFGALLGLAIMTKWFAGALPLALLLFTRPALPALVRLLLALLAVATPWHAYQFLVHRDWFLAEYIGVELLTYAVQAPVQSTAESALAFYAARSLWLLPLLPPLFLARPGRLPALWLAILTLATLTYGFHNASYLAPFAPFLLLLAPKPIPWYFAGLALLLASAPAPPQLPPVDARFAHREVLHLDPDDQLTTTLALDATVRYILFLEHLPPNGPLDFEARGIAVPVDRFLANPAAQVDVILAPTLDQLRQLILASPQRDFLLPAATWQALAPFTPPHDLTTHGPKIWLRSRSPQPGPRPNHFPALTLP